MVTASSPYAHPYESRLIDWKNARALPPPNFAEKLSIYYSRDSAWQFQTLDGEKLSISQFKGKSLFINFWATWCKPCVDELPGIQELYDSAVNRGMVFLLFTDEPRNIVQRFLSKNNLHVPVYAFEGERPEFLASTAVPSTFILDCEGRKAFTLDRSANWGHKSSRAFLESLLNTVSANH